MRIEVDSERQINVHFHHLARRPKKKAREKHAGRFTQVFVHWGPCRKGTTLREDGQSKDVCVSESLVGIAHAHTKLDNFSRAEGRQLALTRALVQLPREARRVVWNTYWQRTGRAERTDA